MPCKDGLLRMYLKCHGFLLLLLYGMDGALKIMFYLFSPFSWKSRFRFNEIGFSCLDNNKWFLC